MRAAGAMAGMASLLLAPGCGDNPNGADEDPIRRANFRSLAARDFLFSCPGGRTRPETATQAARHEELKQLAYRTDAGRALALGENDWAAVRRHDDRAPCAPGEAPYRAALAAFSGALDLLAGRIAARPGAAR